MNEEESTWWLLGLPIDCVTMEQAKGRILEAARTRTPLVFATPNVNFLALARRKLEFREAILRTNLSLVDGMPLVWLARMLGIPVPERVAGSNLIESLLDDDRRPPLKVFFFGGAPGIAETACWRVNEAQRGLKAVGWHDPGFVALEKMSDDETIEKINSSDADMLILALGAEKGHLWIERNRNRLTVPVISHLGAVVNFLAGSVKRAPKILQRVGLEWAWRIREEPSLASRYGRDFLFLVKEFSTAVVPLLFLRSRSKLEEEAMEVDIEHLASGCSVLKLSGSLDGSTVPRLEEAIASASTREAGLTIDLARLRSIDSRAAGFLYGLVFRHPRSVRITGADPNSLLKHHLRLHRAEWLEASSAKHPQALVT